MEQRLGEMVYDLQRSDIRVFSMLAKNTPGCIALTLGEPDFDTPSEIEKQVDVSMAAKETHYIPNDGTDELRSAIASFENKENGYHYAKENVIVTAGASEGLFLAMTGALNPMDEVIIPLPAYPAYKQDVLIARGKPVFLDTSEDHFQITREKLENCLTPRTKAVIINTPNNPAGTVLNRQSLMNIHDAVKDKNIFVIADDVYRQLYYEKKPGSIADFEDLKDQVILVQSFSKPYAMTGWRMGYICADQKIIERLELLHQFMITSTPSLFQRACIQALAYDPVEFRSTYEKRRKYVLARLKDMGLDTIEPEGAFYVFPSVKKFGLSSADFARRMISEAGLAVTPGSAFGTDGFIRLSYCYSDQVLAEGLNRLEKFVRRLEHAK